MKRFIDQIFIRDEALAYAVIAALEKDGDYTTEVYTNERNTCCKEPGIDIKIFRNEKLIHTNIGFTAISDKTKGETTDDTN